MFTAGGFPVAFWTTRNSLVTISMTWPVWKTKSPFLFTASDDKQPGMLGWLLSSRVGEDWNIFWKWIYTKYTNNFWPWVYIFQKAQVGGGRGEVFVERISFLWNMQFFPIFLHYLWFFKKKISSFFANFSFFFKYPNFGLKFWDSFRILKILIKKGPRKDKDFSKKYIPML